MGQSIESWTNLENARLSLRFLRRLPRYLRSRLSLPVAREALKSRLAEREDLFLWKVRKSVFENPGSPYLPLLREASYEFADLEILTRKKGVEGALLELFRCGVFVRVEEFKGRSPLGGGAGGASFAPSDFRNPLSAYHVAASSGGSRSSGTPVFFDLEFIRACAVNSMLVLDARGGLDWLKTTWEVPGGGARFRLLKYSVFGRRPTEWFSQVDPSAPGLHPLYAWSLRAMRWGSILAGASLPRPQYCPVSAPQRLMDWIDEVRKDGRVPHIFTFPSSAVALSEYAKGRGGDLESVSFTLSGEPITSSRLRTIKSTGADPGTRYGSVECGPIGYGCLNPEQTDEMHFQSDLHAAIQPGSEGACGGLGPKAILITSLHPRSPFMFLNVSMGDEADLSNRRCGCPLEGLGWSTHLSRVRSFEKLTSAGMTFLGTDVVRVLEEDLPAAFGGGATDYQLVEEESDSGRPALKLMVHPRLGALSAEEIRNTFLAAVGSASIVDRLMEKSLREADILQVERRPPRLTKQGKILHLHLLKAKDP